MDKLVLFLAAIALLITYFGQHRNQKDRSEKDSSEQTLKLAEQGDATAQYNIGIMYAILEKGAARPQKSL